MKWFMFCLVLSAVSFSCSPDDNTPAGNNVQLTDISGSWQIKQFIDNGQDETYHFSGYTFVFGNSGITAVKGGISVSAIFILSDSTIPDQKMVMYFPDYEPWDELNEDWNILDWNRNTLTLRHVSGGNGGTDELIFEKVK